MLSVDPFIPFRLGSASNSEKRNEAASPIDKSSKRVKTVLKKTATGGPRVMEVKNILLQSCNKEHYLFYSDKTYQKMVQLTELLVPDKCVHSIRYVDAPVESMETNKLNIGLKVAISFKLPLLIS